jgi:hypothetical protein
VEGAFLGYIMTTLSIQQNILYGLGEGSNVGNSIFLSYALRWSNRAYREVYTKAGYKFKNLHKRSIFRTSNGQQTYQAPADFLGLVQLRDETNNSPIDQITPEEFARDVMTKKITDEEFTSDHDVAVSLDNVAVLQYSETVTNSTGTTTYTRDTDYTMAYADGQITVLSTGSMADATTFEIDYIYWNTGKPNQFCLEFDQTNDKYVFKLDPTPESTFVVSLIYPHKPTALSDSVDAAWGLMELAIESGGIYYGSMEIIESAQKRTEFKQIYKDALSDLVKLDQDLVPKHDRIPIFTRHSDYTNRDIKYITRNGI